MNLKKSLASVIVLLSSAGVFGETYTATDVASLTDALGKAVDGDVIECAAGTYPISAELSLSAGVTLRGAGIGRTILKSANSKTSMRILSVSKVDAVVENLTVDGGYLTSGNGAGIQLTAGTVQDCEVMNCSENHWGGVSGCGVYATGADSLVLRCDIHDNYASMGNGIGLCVANYAVARNCLVRDNRCTAVNAHYAAYIHQYGTLENCTVTRNDCWNDAALGTATGNNNHKCYITNCIVWGNTGNTPRVQSMGNLSNAVVAEGWTIAGNIRNMTNTTVEDPDFLDFEGGDFRLDAASPCIEAEQGCYPFDTAAVTCGVFTVTRSAFPGETVVFTAGTFNCTGAYVWNFGDGTASVTTTEPTVTHAYATCGAYDIGLTVGAATCTREAYVKVCPRTMYASNGSASPEPPYATPETAAQYIEDALDIAIDGAEIVVLAGTQQMRGTSPIKIFKGVTVRGETGGKDDVIVQKRASTDQIFHLNHKLARVESLTMDGMQTSHGNGQDKNGGCMRLEGVGGTVSNCVMRGIKYTNWGDRGGGVCMDAGLVTHCVISNNEVDASSGGAGVYMTGGTVANTLIARNRVPGAGYDGGAVKISGAGTLVNCTIVGNTAGRCPGVAFAKDKNNKLNAKVVNCLLSDNVSANIEGAAAGVYNDAQYASVFTACAAPLKINDTCFTGNLGLKNVAVDDFHLILGSVCIDNATSDNVDVPATDLDGNPRLDDSGKLDIGCYELKVEGVQVAFAADVSTPSAALAPFEVTYNASIAGADPTTLTYLWDVYGDGSEIVETQMPTVSFVYEKYGSFKVKLVVVKDGIEYPAVNEVDATSYPPVHYVDVSNATPVAPYDTPAKAANTLEDAVAAAYAGSEIVVCAGRYPTAKEIFIDKSISIRGATGNPEDVVFCCANPNSRHRIFSVNSSGLTIASVTVEGGAVNGNDSRGAGVYFGLSGGTVTNCIVRNCTTSGWNSRGGAIAVDDLTSPSLVTHCVISNNACYPGNVAYDYSGGLAVCLKGGTIRNSLIAYNYQPATDSCSDSCGVVVMSEATARLENCTVAANTGRYCSGVKCKNGAVVNCVIAGNTSTISTDPAAVAWAGDATKFDHCLAPVAINDSCFVQEQPYTAPATGDFTLGAGSEGIDKAATLPWMDGAKDLAGNDRVRGDAPDIGAYEADPAAFAASFAASTTEGFGPLTVTFTVTPVQDSGNGVSCEWTVDGGEPERVESLIFEQTFGYGDHTVSLKVTDKGTGAEFAVPGFVKIYSAPRTLYVAPADGAVTSSYPYVSRETAATNFHHALDAALPGAEIVFLKGLHMTPQKTAFVTSKLTLRGETGDPADVVLRERHYAYRILQLNHREALVHGMTLEGTSSGTGNPTSASCVYIDSNGGAVSNCVLRGGRATIWGDVGGAAYMKSDDAVLTHCVITNNILGCSEGHEKGMAVAMAKGRIENCLVAFNRTGNSSGTTKDSNGGAVYMTGGSMVNCTVVSNSYQGCAGVYADGGTIANCLIVGNQSTIAGGDASVWRGTADRFTHCLGEVKINETCLTGSTEVFRQARMKRSVFIPLGSSAARDAGDRSFVGEATDLYGKPRVVGPGVDLGCAESQSAGISILIR